MPRRISLVTNLLAHIMVTGCPFDENLTGAARDAVAGGTAAVLPFVTNITAPVSHGASFGEEGTRFAKVLFVDQLRIR